MSEYEYKLNNSLYPLISRIHKINILEFGVQKGRSTLKFLDICNKNDGFLFSADIDDCSDVSKDPRWTFIKSRDDNFDLIKSKIPKKVDVIFLDSLHESAHVEKIIYNYFDLLNKDGYFFIDDISHLPYLINRSRNNFYCEINNKETFKKIVEIYNSNMSNFDLSFSFIASGLAIIQKKNENNLNKIVPIKERDISFRNLYRKITSKY
jgi:predicted O-methyltransferase YrrM|tara:strand:- start:8 stop:631 length:624 start_codon:yes stop_codon:yes gene_type:complete